MKAYRGRQLVENYFRDTNQAFYGHKCLVYNQFFFFGTRIRYFANKTAKKLSQKYLKRAGELKYRKHLVQLEISEDERDRRILEKIVESVN